MTLMTVLSSVCLAALLVARFLQVHRARYRDMEPENSHPGRVIPPGTPLREYRQTMTPDPPQAVLPSSIESEMAFLGATIMDNSVIDDVLEVVSAAEMFAFPAHQVVFEAILRLHLDQKPIDLVVLRDELDKRHQLAAAGGVDSLISLVEGVPNPKNAPEYARTVRDKFVLRNILESCQKITHQVSQVTEDVDVVRGEVEKALLQVLANSEKATFWTMTDILHETFQHIQDVHDHKDRLPGIPTGFHELDDLLSGLQPGRLYVVGGRPSMGKSSFALSVLEHVALRERKPVLLFSLDLAAEQVGQAMLCSHARVDSSLLGSGRISPEEFQRLVMAAGDFHEARIFIDDSSDLSVLELRARARRMKARENIQLVVVDYLHRLRPKQAQETPESRRLEVAMASGTLKTMARELQVPVVVLSSLNRMAEGREGHRPQLSDLRDSGSIEEDADAVLLLYREDYYFPASDHKSICQLNVAKNRSGPTGEVQLAFHKQFTRFENLSRPFME